MVDYLEDPRRTEPSDLLPEREMLDGWLEFHRMTLLFKVEGLDDSLRKARPIRTSPFSLHGLVRHMAEVERYWFRNVLARDQSVTSLWWSDADPDADFAPLDDADWDSDLATWQSECAAAREIAAPHGLDDTGVRHGEPCSLRWILVHMIEEYARHNGHADLLRELADGTVGG